MRVLVLARGQAGKGVASVMGFDGAPPRTLSEDFERLARGEPTKPLALAGLPRRTLRGGGGGPWPGRGPGAPGRLGPARAGHRRQRPADPVDAGRQLYLLELGALPGKIVKVDVATGRRDVWREIQPVDRVGVSGIGMALVTPDGSAWAYSYPQFRSSLYLVKGLR